MYMFVYITQKLKNFNEQSQKLHEKRTHICDLYLKTVIFLSIPLSY